MLCQHAASTVLRKSCETPASATEHDGASFIVWISLYYPPVSEFAVSSHYIPSWLRYGQPTRACLPSAAQWDVCEDTMSMQPFQLRSLEHNPLGTLPRAPIPCACKLCAMSAWKTDFPSVQASSSMNLTPIKAKPYLPCRSGYSSKASSAAFYKLIGTGAATLR